MDMSTFCPTCQSDRCMRVGAGAPRTFNMDMVGQIGYTCRYCGTQGWGPGTSSGLICTFEPGDIKVELDGNAWCATRSNFINLQESVAGFGPSRIDAVKDLLANERAIATVKGA